MHLKHLLSAVAVLAAGLSAHATPVYSFTLSGVTLPGGTTLTGTFTTNSSFNTILTADIVASAGGGYPSVTYLVDDPTTNSTPSGNGSYFRLDAPGDELQLSLATLLSATAGSALSLGNSYEHDGGGNRYFTAGSIILTPPPPPPTPASAPEPSSIALLGTGLCALALLGFARRQRLVTP